MESFRAKISEGSREIMGSELVEHNEILRILADTASDFINLPLDDVGPAIQHALEDVALRVGADRAYIFDYDFSKQISKNTFEWCAPGIMPQIRNLSAVPLSGSEWATSLHRSGEPFIEEDVHGMAATPTRDLLVDQEIKSIITIPLMSHSTCEGFIGFDFVRSYHRFQSREVNLLLFFSKMLSGLRMRRAATEELDRARQEIEVFFDTAVSLLCIVDLDGRFHRVSSSWQDILGLPIHQIEGSRFMDFVHPEDAGETRRQFELLRKGKPLAGYVNRYRHANGSHRFIEWNARRVNDLVYSVSTDVSRKMEEERALRASLQRERETAEIKGRLISMASHEFRTPLATIQMAAEMLERYWTKMDRDAIGQRLRLIASTTGELARIISEVLDFSILEAGTTTETPQRIDIVQASREIAKELFDNRGRTHKLIFHSQRESAEMPLMFRLYKHVLANLLENAIKYSAPGSEVELSLEWDKSGRSVGVEVRDHGLGIPEEVRERIWDPFFRANNIGTIRGTGLGLAIAKQAVVAMGGRIDCKPAEKNPGTTFHFTIPARSRIAKKTTPITQS